MAKKCKACGGVYAPVLRDGMRYYHECPPQHRVQVKHADGTIDVVDLDKVKGTDVAIVDVFEPLANARNENVRGSGPDASAPIADGPGADDV